MLCSAVTNGKTSSIGHAWTTNSHVQEGNQILAELNFSGRTRPAFLCDIEAGNELHGNLHALLSHPMLSSSMGYF